MGARSDAGSWKSRFKSCRRRLSEAEEEAKDALSSQAEIARLKQLLADTGVGIGKGAAVAAQHKTAGEPRARRDTPRPRSREARQLSKALETVQAQKDRIQALRHENSDLRKAVKEAQTQKGTIRALSGMNECLRERLGDFQDQRAGSDRFVENAGMTMVPWRVITVSSALMMATGPPHTQSKALSEVCTRATSPAPTSTSRTLAAMSSWATSGPSMLAVD